MKFNIKNLFNKKSLRKLEKATLVGVASLALIIPLVGNSSTSVNADSKSDLEYYENEMEDTGDSMLTDPDEMYLIMKHPALRYSAAAKYEMKQAPYWDDDAWDTYAHHFKQLYSPYLYKYMPKRIRQGGFHTKRDERILYRDQVQMGLLGRHGHKHVHRRIHHARRTRRNRRRYSYKRHAHRRNARKHRSHRHSRR